jgi:hypothetical protein
MKKLVSSVALLAVAGNLLMAGGDLAPVEPAINVPSKETVVVDDNVKYDGFYAGGALGYMRFNNGPESRGYALTVMGGYYFNRYIGVEARYTATVGDVDEDTGTHPVTSRDRLLSNVGIYLKPMYNITTGFSAYGLVGYGQAHAGDLDESGVQWGLGAKYELANGVGIFVDYMNLYDGDDFDGTNVKDAFFSTTNVGASYTF